MKQDRWKFYVKVLWGAVIVLLVISSVLAGLFGGSTSFTAVLAVSVWVVIQLGVLTLLFIIVVRLKEWIEGQVTSMADRRGAVADAELQALRQSMERIEAKVDRIEKVLDGIPE